MVMRVGGLATGMDIEQIVNRLMDAERMPLRRMEQDRTMLTWKQDAFRELNRSLLELDNMMLDMKLSHTYQTKNVQSSQESAITATGSSNTQDGVYHIEVKQLATTAINVGTSGVNPDKTVDVDEQIVFYTFDEAGNKQTHEIEIEDGDTIGNILVKITNQDNNVRAFYDATSERVVLETTRTGNYNTKKDENGNNLFFGGAEIGFDEDSFFAKELGLGIGKAQDDPNEGGDEQPKGEIGGTDAIFTYNYGLELTSKNNSYSINNLDLQFHNVTNGHASISVSNDVEHSFDQIMAFVNKYNEVIDKLNESQQEQKYRDFPPLTKEQKDEMSEDEIEKWEERAKSGILRGEHAITDGMFQMRRSWYSNVETDGEFTSLTQIGITTSPDYLNGGKLIVNEDELKRALRDHPNDVEKLLSNSTEGSSKGLINRLEEAVEITMDKIDKHAGKGTSTLDNYTLGKRMKDLDQRISAFEDRLMRVETRYWNQFTQMEKAIQRMNDQSSMIFSQFGGM